jgi:hypothetical protein
LLLLAAAQAPAADCGRYGRRDELQSCEVERSEHFDILDAIHRPPARALGAEVIRFSRMPSLGGWALIVEIVAGADSSASGRAYIFYGHPSIGWELRVSTRFELPARFYRRLASDIDAAIAKRVSIPLGEDEVIVCTDGPGLLTERVRNGRVQSLTGSCPPTMEAEHPNRLIEAAVQDMLCRRQSPAYRPAYWSGRHCYAPVRTMADQ